jgi:hypothetical protein
MATQKSNKRNTGQSHLRSRDLVLRSLPNTVLQSASDGQENKMGFLIALISMVLVFVLMLPLMGIMYFDILTAKQETKDEVEKMKKIRKELEKDKHSEGN